MTYSRGKNYSKKERKRKKKNVSCDSGNIVKSLYNYFICTTSNDWVASLPVFLQYITRLCSACACILLETVIFHKARQTYFQSQQANRTRITKKTQRVPPISNSVHVLCALPAFKSRNLLYFVSHFVGKKNLNTLQLHKLPSLQLLEDSDDDLLSIERLVPFGMHLNENLAKTTSVLLELLLLTYIQQASQFHNLVSC